jgi:hypothetical protein
VADPLRIHYNGDWEAVVPTGNGSYALKFAGDDYDEQLANVHAFGNTFLEEGGYDHVPGLFDGAPPEATGEDIVHALFSSTDELIVGDDVLIPETAEMLIDQLELVGRIIVEIA